MLSPDRFTKRILRGLNQSSENGTLGVFLFPKRFEMEQFLKVALQHHLVISHDSAEGLSGYLLHIVDDGKSVVHYSIYCIGDSDIAFSFKLGELINKLKKHYNHNINVILCGTAGGSTSLNHKVGDSYKVGKALKLDRGTITGSAEGLKMKIRYDKKAEAQTSHPSIMDNATAVCTNHLMAIDAKALDISKEMNAIFDMETFEFFSQCRLGDVSRYDCIRIISDVHGDLENPSEEHESKLKEIRKTIDMAPLYDELMRVLNSQHHRYKHQEAIPPSHREHRNYVDLCARLGVAPMNMEVISEDEKMRLQEQIVQTKLRELREHREQREPSEEDDAHEVPPECKQN